MKLYFLLSASSFAHLHIFRPRRGLVCSGWIVAWKCVVQIADKFVPILSRETHERSAHDNELNLGGGGWVKLEKLWNIKNSNQLCWLTTHEGWQQQNKQSPGQLLLQHHIPSQRWIKWKIVWTKKRSPKSTLLVKKWHLLVRRGGGRSVVFRDFFVSKYPFHESSVMGWRWLIMKNLIPAVILEDASYPTHFVTTVPKLLQLFHSSANLCKISNPLHVMIWSGN